MRVLVCTTLFFIVSMAYKVYVSLIESKCRAVATLGLKALKKERVFSYYSCLILLISSWIFLLLTLYSVVTWLLG